MARDVYAHCDEGGGRLPDGSLLYGIAAVISDSGQEAALTVGLRQLRRQGDELLHHADIHPKRRPDVASGIAALDFAGAIVVCRPTAPREQERTRSRLLSWLLPRLQYE